MNIRPTNIERKFDENVLLVTKTDLKGKITYANRGFMDIVSMSEKELVAAMDSYLTLLQAVPYSEDATLVNESAKDLLDNTLKLQRLSVENDNYGLFVGFLESIDIEAT